MGILSNLAKVTKLNRTMTQNQVCLILSKDLKLSPVLCLAYTTITRFLWSNIFESVQAWPTCGHLSAFIILCIHFTAGPVIYWSLVLKETGTTSTIGKGFAVYSICIEAQSRCTIRPKQYIIYYLVINFDADSCLICSLTN